MSRFAVLCLGVAVLSAGKYGLGEAPATLPRLDETIVYTVHETLHDRRAVDIARQVPTDVAIRAWFKWHNAPDWAKLAWQVPLLHERGTLFGGGITCSALYDNENGLPRERWLDMATRGTAGELLDAWDQPGCRHGTLSNPRYIEYLLSWCTRQIDQGADYLFMDEINAALGVNEGFDDYALADFRAYLLDRYGREGWTPTDRRWTERFGIDLANRAIAANGSMRDFSYREYLRTKDLVKCPLTPGNPLAADWHAFRFHRDERAWKQLADDIRAYAKRQGRTVYLSGNGLARHVDLQVLGVWGDWLVKNDRVDLEPSQLERWRSTVAAGRSLAGRRVPVVFFHDWGFGGFPWIKVPAGDRRLWLRVRAPEIYAAGAIFAFPVQGPMGNDAQADGTLPDIIRLARFFRQYKDLFLKGTLLGFAQATSPQPHVGLALWEDRAQSRLMVHVINRQVAEGRPARRPITIELPVSVAPRAVEVVSPEGESREPASCRVEQDKLRVELPVVDAYCAVLLRFDELPVVPRERAKLVPVRSWSRPERNEFAVQADGTVIDQWALPGYLQGKLHDAMRDPPTFVVDSPAGGVLEINVDSVASVGARLEYQFDGTTREAVDLPDRDGKNDGQVQEHNRTLRFDFPPGKHRLTLCNTGRDWLTVGWYGVVYHASPRH